jgi:hypothetical protein
MKNLLVIVPVLLMFSIASAQDLYVIPGASLPFFDNIQDAYISANDGDRILVQAGMYLDVLYISEDKSVTIEPIVHGGEYELVGGIQFGTANTLTENRTINITGCKTSSLTDAGSPTNSLFTFIINFNTCHVTGNCSTASGAIFNSYYSEYNGQFSSTASEHIVGNDFVNPGIQNLQYVTLREGGHISLDEYKMLIICNRFYDYELSVLGIYGANGDGNQYPYQASEIILANNNFEKHYSLGRFLVAGNAGSSQYNLEVPIKIINNTFRSYIDYPYHEEQGVDSWGELFYFGTYTSLIFANNIIFEGELQSINSNCGACYMFHITGADGSVSIKNNVFNKTTNDDLSCDGTHNFWAGFCESVGEIENNILVLGWDVDVDDINENGVNTGNQFVNAGIESIEYRDIDNSNNDLGTGGGPYCFANYKQPGGNACIINLDIPSSIFGLPNLEYEIKSKSIIRN